MSSFVRSKSSCLLITGSFICATKSLRLIFSGSFASSPGFSSSAFASSALASSAFASSALASSAFASSAFASGAWSISAAGRGSESFTTSDDYSVEEGSVFCSVEVTGSY
jgi:hypothetical protein